MTTAITMSSEIHSSMCMATKTKVFHKIASRRQTEVWSSFRKSQFASGKLQDVIQQWTIRATVVQFKWANVRKCQDAITDKIQPWGYILNSLRQRLLPKWTAPTSSKVNAKSTVMQQLRNMIPHQAWCKWHARRSLCRANRASFASNAARITL